MTNYEFGCLVTSFCDKRRIRDAILESVGSGRGLCAAENGYVETVADQASKSGVEKAWLAKVTKSLAQKELNTEDEECPPLERGQDEAFKDGKRL